MEPTIPSSAEAEIRQRNAEVGIDFAGFELRIAKHVMDGKIFIDTETTGETMPVMKQSDACIPPVWNHPSPNFQQTRRDIYVYLASRLFGVPKKNITPAMRKAAKDKVYWVLYRGKTMNRNQTIKIARAIRNYPGGIAEVTLVWKVFYSKFGVEYRQVATLGNLQQTVPDWCVKNWLKTFVRDQSQLQRDSYYLVAPPTEAWRNTIEAILRQC